MTKELIIYTRRQTYWSVHIMQSLFLKNPSPIKFALYDNLSVAVHSVELKRGGGGGGGGGGRVMLYCILGPFLLFFWGGGGKGGPGPSHRLPVF